MHHDDAGMPQRRLVREIVPGIIADVIESDIEIARGRSLPPTRKYVSAARFAISAARASE